MGVLRAKSEGMGAIRAGAGERGFLAVGFRRRKSTCYDVGKNRVSRRIIQTSVLGGAKRSGGSITLLKLVI